MAAGPIEGAAVELVFVHRDDLPRRTRAERLAATTIVAGLTPVQREVLAAPQKYPPGLAGSTDWHAFRLPMTELGRAILRGHSEGPLAAEVAGRPLYAALVDRVAGKRERHRRAVERLVAQTDRGALSAAVRACKELVEPMGLAGMVPTSASLASAAGDGGRPSP